MKTLTKYCIGLTWQIYWTIIFECCYTENLFSLPSRYSKCTKVIEVVTVIWQLKEQNKTIKPTKESPFMPFSLSSKIIRSYLALQILDSSLDQDQDQESRKIYIDSRAYLHLGHWEKWQQTYTEQDQEK